MDLREYESVNRDHAGAETDTFTAARYRQFAGVIPHGAVRVLDVGASTGRGGLELKRLRPELELSALDCVAERLEALPSVYSGGLHASSTAIPLQDGELDVIVAGEFLEHLTETDAVRTLGEFSRVLSAGGVVALTTPNPGYLRLRLTGGSVLGGHHLSQYAPQRLRELLEEAGFGVVCVRGSGRVSSVIGTGFPLDLYGSYLIVGRKGE